MATTWRESSSLTTQEQLSMFLSSYNIIKCIIIIFLYIESVIESGIESGDHILYVWIKKGEPNKFYDIRKLCNLGYHHNRCMKETN